ncbi:Ribosome biogenesis protein SSF1 [Ceratocystis lukuohia]|uniref:Brix domain-containing protein C1B9.03c n=3 Tax=Ceratocystis TaxID=5157 RepID=A0A0F8B233_CERFI|nr:Brix domain-containing protein C1B9.03c [Ceratocystis platani]PHH51869.1 Ribosome biogenesis protein SSF1 [Ceratocystis fimbriata CBS 114723]
MARRRSKKRTHNKPELAFSKDNKPSNGATIKAPKNMVIRIGASEVGSSISQLVTDVRRVMEPNTATRLKERRANRLRDYLTMCGPLGVTHLMTFSRSDAGNTNMRVCVTPRGPTLNFRVERYSLVKDVQKSQRHPLGGGSEYAAPPLLVMNNFSTAKDHEQKIPKHLESLTTTVFQSLFPPINPQTTPLKTIRRVLLLNREASEDDDAFTLNFRHYAIVTKTAGLSRPLRRLRRAEKLLSSKSRKGGLPNLGKLNDIADFMIGGENGEGYVSDYTSGSEVETDAEVEILDNAPRKVSLRARRAASGAAARGGDGDDDDAADEEAGQVEKRAVKLVELGPRLRLRLTKVEEGVCSGRVLWHEYIEKSKEEVDALEEKWEKKRVAKEERKKAQRANLEKKKGKKSQAKDGDEGVDEDSDDDDEINYSDMDLDEYEQFKGNGEDEGESGDDDMWEDEE